MYAGARRGGHRAGRQPPRPLKEGFLRPADDRCSGEVFHARTDEFAAFALMIKGGVGDHLFPG
jgi:hypothetical protein